MVKKKRQNLYLTASTHLYLSEIYRNKDQYTSNGAYENFKKCQGLERQRKTMTTASAVTSEICEHAKCLFKSKGETQVEDLKYCTALKIHTAFCWVMSGRWVPVFCRNILASPSHQKAATVQHIAFTCEWYGMSLVEVKELAVSLFTLGYPADGGSSFWNIGT